MSRLTDAAALAVLQAAMLAGFPRHLDVHVADEAFYQQQGAALLRGALSEELLVIGPLFSAAYALLQLVLGDGFDRMAQQDVMSVLVSFAMSFSLWWAIAPVVPRGVALLAAAWYASSPIVLSDVATWGVRVNAYGFSASLVTLALGCAVRGRGGAALLVLGLGAVNRQELAPWLLAAGVGMLLARDAGSGPARRVAAFAAIAAAIALLLLLAISPVAKLRAWRVFAYEYAVETDAGGAVDAVTRDRLGSAPELSSAVREAFPGCESIAAAAWRAPVAFARHVASSAARLPGVAVDSFAAPFAHRPWLRWCLVAIAVLALVRARLRGASAPPPPLPATARVLCWASLCTLLALLATGPWAPRLLPFAPVVALFAARGGRGGLGAAPIVVAGLALVPGPFSGPPRHEPQARETVSLLRSIAPADGDVVRMRFPAGQLWLAGSAARGVELGDLRAGAGAEAGDESRVATTDLARGADWILVTATDVALLGEDVVALLTELASERWALAGSSHAALLFRRRT